MASRRKSRSSRSSRRSRYGDAKLTPMKRMALVEAATSKSVRAGHVYKAATLHALAREGLLRQVYGEMYEITPEGRARYDAHRGGH